MTNRRGFTLAELMVVVCIMGILATIALPRMMDVRDRAEGAALIERLEAIRIAFVAAGEPLQATMTAPSGKVPDPLSRGLAPDFFLAESGIHIKSVASAGGSVGLTLLAMTPKQMRVLAAADRLYSKPHSLGAGRIFIFPLSDAAVAAMIKPANAAIGANGAAGIIRVPAP